MSERDRFVTDRGIGRRVAVILGCTAAVSAIRIVIGGRVPRAWAWSAAIALLLPVAVALDVWFGPRRRWPYHVGRLVLGLAVAAVAGFLAQ